MRAIVLCAGYGTRLGDLSSELPKAMLPLKEEPLLAYTLRYLALYGFKDVAINLHFQPEIITGYFGNGQDYGVRIHYSYESRLLGTAGAAKNLEGWLYNGEDFLLLYGDLLIDQDLTEIVGVHRRKKAIATLLLHQNLGSNSLVETDASSQIVGFIERPTEEQRVSAPFQWVNSGVYMLNSRVLEYIDSGRSVDFPRDIFSKILHQERLFGVPMTGYRCAIDSPERYAEAEKAVSSGKYRQASDTN